MTPREPQHRTFTASLDCRYLLHIPDQVTPKTALVVTLHGFSSNPEVMLQLTASVFGPDHAIASLQGPYQFYRDVKAEEVGYGWITRRNPQSSIRLHHDMLAHVLDDAGRECAIPAERRFLCAFSQPVGLNYRFAATFPDAVRGVVAICGGLPGDWETAPYRKVKASILHIARSADEVYPPAVTDRYPERLRVRADDVEFHQLDGGHRFPSKSRTIIENWLARLLR